MRIRMAFPSSALVAAAGLIAATGAMAQVTQGASQTAPPGPPPTSCEAGAYTVAVSGGPTTVSCAESMTGQCTEIEYTVSGSSNDFTSTDHVGALEGVGVAYVKAGSSYCSPSPCQISPAGQGDSLTGLGKLAVHEQAVRVNPNDIKSTAFTIGLVGDRRSSPTSVVVKKGKAINSCRILGIGLEAGTNPLATTTPDLEEVLGGKCKVHVHTDPRTQVTTVTAVSGSGCTSVDGPFPIGSVQISVNGEPTFPVEFSEGFNFILGSGSCTYKQYYPTAGPIYRICY